MKRETLSRLEALERVKAGPDPIMFMIAPTDAPGHYWECNTFVCQHTGWRCERDPGEIMADFVQRAEIEAHEYANASGSPLLILHPDVVE